MRRQYDSERINRAAAALCSARLERRPVGPLPREIRPADEPEAYEVQEELHRLLTDRGWGAVVGHKIGCTTPVMQAALELDHPVSGGVFAPTVHDRDGVFERALYVDPGVECEIAVRLERDLPARGAPYDRAAVARAVGACMAAFELTDARYTDRAAVGVPTQVADDYYNAGSVLGEARADFDPFELDRVASRLFVNGEEVGAGTGAMVLGHPLEALAWLANSLAARGRALRAGEFVSLGSVIAVWRIAAGEEAHVIHDPLGEVTLRMV